MSDLAALPPVSLSSRFLASLARRVAPLSLAITGCATALVLAIGLRDPLKDDIAWLLYVAQQWMHGQRLYVDLVEVNPPLVVWLYAIPVAIGGSIGIAPKLIAIPMFTLLALACSWWASSPVSVARRGTIPRAPIFALIACVVLLIPGEELGQREHLLAMTALPYLALVGNELAGRRAPVGRAVLIGILAALGCALKPRYIGAFGLVELFAVCQGGKLLRPVSLAAAATLGAYALAVAVWVPRFFTEAVPMALALYGVTDERLLDVVLDCWRLVAGVGIGFLLLAAHRGERDRVMRLAVLFVFAAGATMVCIMEGKNWFYHRLPATISIIIGLVALLAWVVAQVRSRSLPRGWLATYAVFASVTLFLFGLRAYERLEPRVTLALTNEAASGEQIVAKRLAAIVRREHARSYLAFSEWIALGFPVVNNTGVVWASRFDSMWALQARLDLDGLLSGIGSPKRGAPDTDDAARDWPVARWVVDDFLRVCPDLVVVDLGAPADYVALLSDANASFRRVWRLYRPIDRLGRIIVFRNGANDATRRAADCGKDQSIPVALR